HASQHVKRHPRALRAVDLGHQIFPVLAQTRAFGGEVERVEELLHPPASSAVSLKAACKDLLRKPSADLAMALGRQISSSEQARERSAAQRGRGVGAGATTWS